MPAESVIVILVMFTALVLLVTEWVSAGITGVLIMLALALSGVLTPEATFHGLTNEAVVTVAAMFVISSGLARTGAVGRLAALLKATGKRSGYGAYWTVLLLVLVLSAFVNNTPLVIIFLPLVIGMSTRLQEPPSKLLIPLSFLSIMGGTCTLIGTSTNLVVASALADVSSQRLHLGMFDFTVMGVILAATGATLLLVFRRRLLPTRTSLDLLADPKGVTTEYLTQLEVGSGSRLIGKPVARAFRTGTDQEPIQVVQLIRDDVIRPPNPDEVLVERDLLLVKGSPATIVELHRKHRQILGKDDEAPGKEELPGRVALTLFEVVVTPGSRWIGRPVGSLRLRRRFGASVYAVQRHNAHLRDQVERLPLKSGDVLLVQGPISAIRNLKASESVLVVEGVDRLVPHTSRAPIAVLSVVLFMALAVSGLAPVHVAALLAAALVVVGGCLSATEGYHAVNWDVLFLIAGTLALGKAFQDTGLASAAADHLVDWIGGVGSSAAIAVVFLLTMAFTQVISNNAAAALMTPLAFDMGLAFGPTPGVMPFVMAVAFGASCAFLTPIGYQTNLLVYGPGGYRFADFLRPGLPLTLMYLLLCTILLPVIYG